MRAVGVGPCTWYHLAGTWDGSTKRIYINGTLAGSIAGTTVDNDTHDIVIGGITRTSAMAAASRATVTCSTSPRPAAPSTRPTIRSRSRSRGTPSRTRRRSGDPRTDGAGNSRIKQGACWAQGRRLATRFAA